MSVTPEEEARLLAAISETTASAARAHDAAMAAAIERREAVRAAMDAGIERDKISRAAGVNRQLLYRMLRKDRKEEQ